jgi:Flp pilus assembly protein TadG
MKLPFRRRRAVSRGQALVEMAIILPVLVLLLLLAVDFGRVFFGWVALNNVTRIGANEAARLPTPWADGVAQDAEDPYYKRMIADMQAMNCDADADNDGDVDDADLPPPVFTDRTDDAANPYEVGDEVSVTLTCDFGFLTPLVGAIVGDPLTITASSTFLVFGGEINGIPVVTDPVPSGCIGTDLEVPDLVDLTVGEARTSWTNAGFAGSFTPTTAPDENIVLTQATSPTSVPGDCRVYTTSVTVTHKVPDTCAANEAIVPQLVQDPALTVAQARAAWTGAGFSGGFTPLTGSDNDTVTDMTVTPPPDVEPGNCALLTSGVNVSHQAPPLPAGQCRMTQILGFTINAAQSEYLNRGFIGAFTYNPSNKPTWKVKTQNLIGGQVYACTADLHVQLQAP